MNSVECQFMLNRSFSETTCMIPTNLEGKMSNSCILYEKNQKPSGE
jgi:hypothetical protein